jgi:small subunit ribosomal protein S11
MAEDNTPELEKVEVTAPEEAAVTTPDAPTEDAATGEKPVVKKKKNKRSVTHGHVHVLSTFNNTIITVSDEKGNVLTSSSAGAAGFRGSKKGTAYAAQIAAEKAIGAARQDYGLVKTDVSVKGVGMGREAAIRTLISQKIQVESIRDITGIPHGGVRPRKPKRN